MNAVPQEVPLSERLGALAAAFDKGIPYRWKGITVDLGTGGVLDPREWRIHLTALPVEGGLHLTLGSPEPGGAAVQVLVPSSPPQRLHLEDVRAAPAALDAAAVQIARAQLVQSERGIRAKPLGEVFFSRRSGVQEMLASSMDANGLWPAMSALPRLGERLATYGQDPRVLEVQRRVARGERLAAEIVDEFKEDGLPEREVAIGLLLAMFGAGVDTGVIEGVMGDEVAKRGAVESQAKTGRAVRNAAAASVKLRKGAANRKRAYALQEGRRVLAALGVARTREQLAIDVSESWKMEGVEGPPGLRTILRYLQTITEAELAGSPDDTSVAHD